MSTDKTIETLYLRYGPMVYRRCYRLLQHDESAKDAMQDVFLSLAAHGQRLTLDSPSSMLYRMATNVCLNMIRQHKRRAVHHADGDDVPELLERIASAVDIERQVIANRVKDFIFRQQKESTEVIATLYLVDGMTLEEVAAEVNMSVSGVRKRLRALASHVKELEGMSDGQ